MGYCVYELIGDNLDLTRTKHFGWQWTEENKIAVYLDFQDKEFDIKEFDIDLDSKLSVIESEVQEAMDHLEVSFMQLVNEAVKGYREQLEQINNDTIEWDVFFEDFDFDTIENFDDISDEELEKIRDSINWDKIDIDKVWND